MRSRTIREMFPDLKPKEPSGTVVWGMMLALDDPLRDTPEKAARYAVLVHSISHGDWDKVTDADVAAALKLVPVARAS